jgi:2-dehydropantoate 2-reductase
VRIAIVGAGGVGSYFGARLLAGGEQVVFLARGAQLAALATRGLLVTGASGELRLPHVTATADAAAVGTVDAVLVAVKSWQLPAAARGLAPLVGPETVVVPLLNGVDAADQLAAVLGPAPVAAGLCAIVAYLVAPGHVHHEAVEPRVVFGELAEGPSPRLERLRAAFQRAGVRAEIPADIRVALWQKLLFIAPVSGVGALARVPIGAWRSVPASRQLAERAVRELVAVARALGIALPDDAVERTLAFVDALEPGSTSSLQRDVAAGRPSELEAQLGTPLRLAAEAGVETPALAFLHACLLPQELAARRAAGDASAS